MLRVILTIGLAAAAIFAPAAVLGESAAPAAHAMHVHQDQDCCAGGADASAAACAGLCHLALSPVPTAAPKRKTRRLPDRPAAAPGDGLDPEPPAPPPRTPLHGTEYAIINGDHR
jgi:hypothetical protein